MTLGDRIVIMKDGYIQQIGTPQQVFQHPRNLFVAGFIGTPQMNFFNAKLKKINGKYTVDLNGYSVVLADEKQEALLANGVEDQHIVLGVRPEHIVLSDSGVEAVIDVSEMMGSSVHLHVTALDQDVVLVVSAMDMTSTELSTLSTGSRVCFAFGGNNCHVFNRETGINLEI